MTRDVRSGTSSEQQGPNTQPYRGARCWKGLDKPTTKHFDVGLWVCVSGFESLPPSQSPASENAYMVKNGIYAPRR